jgi:hypothetical protein
MVDYGCIHQGENKAGITMGKNKKNLPWENPREKFRN